MGGTLVTVSYPMLGGMVRAHPDQSSSSLPRISRIDGVNSVRLLRCILWIDGPLTLNSLSGFASSSATMAEVAGLVLGALPIAIWALEKYSEAFETFHRYRTTIESFRSQLIIQQYQLEKTLSNLGLGKNASKEELQECFEAKFPQISHELLFIVRQMDDIAIELGKSLEVDINAEQDQALDKIQWNWSRVKHSLGTKKRNKILESLRQYNEDLRRVVEKTELPEEADSSQIQKLKLRFSPQRCSSTRKYLISLHRALEAGLCCACPSPHQAAIDLDWEAYESDEKQVYKVAVSYRKSIQPPQPFDSWKKLHISLYTAPKLALTDLNQIIPQPPPRVTSPKSSRKLKFVSLSSFAGLRTPSRGTSQPSSSKSKIVRFAPFLNPQTPPPSPTISSSISAVMTVSSSVINIPSEEVTSLCDAVCTENTAHKMVGHFKDPEKDPDKNDYQRFRLEPNQPDLPRITEVFQLGSITSLGELPAGKKNPIHSLSAKQRYGIAAAIAWSVLHLGETPWVGEFWGENQAKLFLEKNKHAGMPDSLRPHLSYSFSTTAAEERHSSELEELIPNRVIFALGMILVKLCMIDLKSGSLIREYLTAVSRLDEVRRIAGCAYGDAAERCVKFSFPGRDVHKKFDVLQFRKQFYDDVVAPVQATYYLMPG
ncbi:hypothetical protein F4861DRAFT_515561 [Xylaria intraflava]|nr:hypothetical protein F4861DRAFT_515561 [Xylaria intraflava]